MLTTETNQSAIEYADLAARGEVNYHCWGRHTSRRLSKKHQVEYEAAKERHYLIDHVRGRALGSDLYNAYCHWCEATGSPCIAVLVSRGLADVDTDLIYLRGGRYLNLEAQLQVDAIYRTLPRKCTYRLGMMGAWCYVLERVPLDQAFSVAESLYRIVSTAELLIERPKWWGSVRPASTNDAWLAAAPTTYRQEDLQ